MQPLKPTETEMEDLEEDPDDLEAMVRQEERRQEEYFRQNPDGTQEDYDLFKSLCELADVDVPEGEKKKSVPHQTFVFLDFEATQSTELKKDKAGESVFLHEVNYAVAHKVCDSCKDDDAIWKRTGEELHEVRAEPPPVREPGRHLQVALQRQQQGSHRLRPQLPRLRLPLHPPVAG